MCFSYLYTYSCRYTCKIFTITRNVPFLPWVLRVGWNLSLGLEYSLLCKEGGKGQGLISHCSWKWQRDAFLGVLCIYNTEEYRVEVLKYYSILSSWIHMHITFIGNWNSIFQTPKILLHVMCVTSSPDVWQIWTILYFEYQDNTRAHVWAEHPDLYPVRD
jgi:hypothetical protein